MPIRWLKRGPWALIILLIAAALATDMQALESTGHGLWHGRTGQARRCIALLIVT